MTLKDTYLNSHKRFLICFPSDLGYFHGERDVVFHNSLPASFLNSSSDSLRAVY